MWLHSLKVAQLLRSAACLHTNQSRSYLNHLVLILIPPPPPTAAAAAAIIIIIIPDPLVRGITYLLAKGQDGEGPSKYRPITCFCTIYKIYTACTAEKIYRHLEKK